MSKNRPITQEQVVFTCHQCQTIVAGRWPIRAGASMEEPHFCSLVCISRYVYHATGDPRAERNLCAILKVRRATGN